MYYSPSLLLPLSLVRSLSLMADVRSRLLVRTCKMGRCWWSC